MGKVIEKSGNLFSSSAIALGHGVNTVGAMGAGIAVDFREEYPEMYEKYRRCCADGSLKPGQSFIWADKTGDVVVNIASQQRTGKDARLEWLESGLDDALTKLSDREYMSSIGYKGGDIELLALPRIGCGYGGLKWSDVLPVIVSVTSNYDIDVEVWTFSN